MAKLSSEERSRIAKEAAARRLAKKREQESPLTEPTVVEASQSEEKHCPACLAGESLEEGEGTHILATVEHPVVLPAAFQDAETSVVVPQPSAKPKPVPKRLPKELRNASSYAEKRLPKAIQEKIDLQFELQKREAEIQELTRVIQALSGHVPVGVPSSAPMPNPSYMSNQVPFMPQVNPQPTQAIQPPSNGMPVISPVKPMRAGGAGVLDVPGHWYNE
jgi:hypothetical protein